MQDLQDMLNIPDSPRAETPSAEMSHSLFAIPDSSSSSPTPSNTDSSPVITLRIFTYADYLGTPPSPSLDSTSISTSVFHIPESRPPTPIAYPATLFDIPPSRPPTPMVVDDTFPIITEAGQADESAFQTAAHTPRRQKTPPINGRNLIPFLPIITSRAALIRGALLERRSEQVYLRSKIDSVLQDMAELERQMDTMDAFRVIRAAEEQQKSS